MSQTIYSLGADRNIEALPKPNTVLTPVNFSVTMSLIKSDGIIPVKVSFETELANTMGSGGCLKMFKE